MKDKEVVKFILSAEVDLRTRYKAMMVTKFQFCVLTLFITGTQHVSSVNRFSDEMDCAPEMVEEELCIDLDEGFGQYCDTISYLAIVCYTGN